MLKRMGKFIHNRKGNMYIQTIIFLLLTVIILLFAVDLIAALMQYQNVTYSTKMLATLIECDGQVTSNIDDQLHRLNVAYGMDMRYEVIDTTYLIGSGRKIQFGNPFTVVIHNTYRLKIADPLFAGPIYFDINMQAKQHGMSEVYWK